VLATDLKTALESSRVEYELITHDRTLTAAAEADAVGVPPAGVGKTIVLFTPDGYVRAVLAASDRLDLHKVRAALGADARLATEAELASAYPMFELGAVPPFAGPAGDRVLVDSGLGDLDTIVIEAGTHNESVRLKSADLLALSAAEIADLAE
jgi:Ala-tRNA(Pro) deacylase